jgi:hypothetical protein
MKLQWLRDTILYIDQHNLIRSFIQPVAVLNKGYNHPNTQARSGDVLSLRKACLFYLKHRIYITIRLSSILSHIREEFANRQAIASGN